MNINNEKVFKNVDIPDMDTDLNNIANEYWNNILNNYTKIANDSKKILEISLKKDICKPLVIYYLFFAIEIFLKLYLLNFSSIEEVDKCAHNITRLTQRINENKKDLNFKELYFLLKKLKNSKKQNINFDKYYDFKYNRGFEEKNLIFEQKVSKEDTMTIMEVLRWIDLHLHSA